jgi:hypothetical protein
MKGPLSIEDEERQHFSSSMISRHGFTIFWIIHGNESIDIGDLDWLGMSVAQYSKPG